MPQPLTLKQQSGTTWHPMSLKERPDCALGIALVAGVWAYLEFSLADMFSFVTGESDEDDEGITTVTLHPIATAAVLTLESLHARLEVIAASIELMLPHMSADFEELSVGIKKCARERNRIVHGCWGINKKYPDAVIRVVPARDEYVKYTPRDFDDIVRRLRAQTHAIRQFQTLCSTRPQPKPA